MIIYLDLDGVLTQCHMCALQFYGMNPNEYPRGMRVKDILAGAGITTKAKYEDFWADFGEDFWDSLIPTDECDRLLRKCAGLVGEGNIFIASRPTKNPQSLSGKMFWIYENLPKWIHNQVIFLRHKELLANVNTLLIDDSPTNCARFRRAGGYAIMFKRPWNDNENMTSTEWLGELQAAFQIAGDSPPPSEITYATLR